MEMNIIRVYIVSILVFLTGCRADDDYYIEPDYNRLAFLIADNYNLSTFQMGMQRTGLDKVLIEDGPFTVLAPSDEAFLSAGFGYESINRMSSSQLQSMFNYHVLDGIYDLNKLPFLFNQEIITKGGKPVFITRWVKDQDTVVTINGSSVHMRNITASNGIAQVLGGVLASDVQDDVVDVITNRNNLTLFSEALSSSGLKNELRDMPSCTVFVPDNNAMAEFGYSTVQQINQASPVELKEMIRRHVLPDRRFVNDFDLSIDPTETGSFQVDYYNGATDEIVRENAPGATRGSLTIRMLDGSRLTSTYTSGFMTVVTTVYPGIRLTIRDSKGEEAIVSVVNKDFISANGVVHLIDKVLQ